MPTAVRDTALTRKLGMVARANPPTRRSDTTFRASSYMDCLRSKAYEILCVPASDEVYNPDYAMAADQGNVIHRAIQRTLVQAGMVALLPSGPALEVSVTGIPERYRMIGTLDAVLEIERKGAKELWLLDIKSVAHKYLFEDYAWRDAKLAHYAAQLQVYMHFFRMPDGRQVTNAYIYMISRNDTSDRRLFTVAYDPAWLGPELMRVEEAAWLVDAGRLPEPEPARGPCTFCAHKTLCKATR